MILIKWLKERGVEVKVNLKKLEGLNREYYMMQILKKQNNSLL